MKVAALSLLFVCATSLAAQTRTLYRSPAISKTHVVFVYAGDLWRVPRSGGEAVRLTSGPGLETNPSFSPDGSMIAFTGQYDGNTDVYIVPAAGGVPKRLTFHPGPDTVQGWTPDGKRVLFTHTGSNHNNAPRLFTVDLEAGFPQEVPLPQASFGSFSPDGSKIVYSPLSRANLIWKNYRGGRATPLWIANLKDSSIQKLPRTDSNDFNPMWVGNRIYFLSDRNGRDTLFEFDLATFKVERLTAPHDSLDIKSASATADAIAYERFGEIHLLDLKGRKTSKLNITVNGDVSGVRPRLEKVARYITNYGISPTGVRAVFEARGDIFTVPAEKGDIRNLTATSGVAERDPAWSPDGRFIAFFSDESGEYQLHLVDQTGRGAHRKIPLGTPATFYYNPTWSPDSKKIAYADKRGSYWYVDIDKPQPVLVDTAVYQTFGGAMRPVWSPDSQWLAYSRSLKSGLGAIFVYSLASGKATQFTDGLSDARFPAWDRNGKHLYFAASTDSGPLLLGLDLSNLTRTVTRTIYVTVLRKDDPSPLAPESDEEKPVEEKKEEKKPEPKKDEKVDVVIDLDNIGQRILPLPLPARNYINLTAGKPGVLFFAEAPPNQSMFTGPGSVSIQKYEMSKRKAETFQSGATNFDISANGEKILMSMGQGRFVLAGTGAPPKPGDGALKLENMETILDPQAEWRQMFKEAWRIERDFFYDPKHHGLDLQAAAERYELYLKNVGHRSDLTYLFMEMLGQLSVGHLYIGGGDYGEQPEQVRGGLLGCDYRLENGRYRFARVFNGENWNPSTRAPLTQPGVNVKAGEYLLAVNGKELRDTDNVYRAFEATAGKSVVIRVGPNPNGEGARDVTVVPVEDEAGLRTLAWIEDNRRWVDKASGGKLAYIHLPDTGGGGFTYFNRYYFAQTDKQGAIIDERFNRGGLAADYIIDHLRRPVWNYWSSRDGGVYSTPGKVLTGPMVMLANENSGSGGDLLPWLFQRAKLGPVVGKRTWGGLVGIGGYPQLIDGGTITAPHFGFFTPEGKWEVENRGTPPDVEVDLDPKAWREGRDTQLEKAVELAMAELLRNPPKAPVRPAFPDYHKGTSLSNSKAAAKPAGN